mmetsp:Transcript_25188/g.42252  ORF Transcript_25188/g.42252 Transcript_25188/m.42252 type:complete len:134 (+) Transcript_25188:650-1051(+)
MTQQSIVPPVESRHGLEEFLATHSTVSDPSIYAASNGNRPSNDSPVKVNMAINLPLLLMDPTRDAMSRIASGTSPTMSMYPGEPFLKIILSAQTMESNSPKSSPVLDVSAHRLPRLSALLTATPERVETCFAK